MSAKPPARSAMPPPIMTAMKEIGLPVNKLEKGLAFLLISLFHEPFRSAATAVSIL